MRYRTAILILVATLCATACEKVLEIDDSPSNRQIVLNAIPSAGQRAFINLSYTHFFLDNVNAQPIDGADITLYVNGAPVRHDSVSPSGCNYFFPYKPAPDDSLEIAINAGGSTVSAHTYIPRVPVVENVRFTDYASPSFNFYEAKFDLTDHAGLDEYYCMAVTVRDSGARYNAWRRTFDTVDTIRSNYILVPSNPDLTSSEVNPYLPMAGYNMYTRLMCTDKLLDGKTEEVLLYILRLVDTNEVAPFKHEYTLTIESVTPARFRYLLRAVSSSSMGSFFAEQARPYTNVSGGLGIFAGNAQRKYTFWPDTLAGGGGAAALPPDLLRHAQQEAARKGR